MKLHAGHLFFNNIGLRSKLAAWDVFRTFLCFLVRSVKKGKMQFSFSKFFFHVELIKKHLTPKINALLQFTLYISILIENRNKNYCFIIYFTVHVYFFVCKVYHTFFQVKFFNFWHFLFLFLLNATLRKMKLL